MSGNCLGRVKSEQRFSHPFAEASLIFLNMNTHEYILTEEGEAYKHVNDLIAVTTLF